MYERLPSRIAGRRDSTAATTSTNTTTNNNKNNKKYKKNKKNNNITTAPPPPPPFPFLCLPRELRDQIYNHLATEAGLYYQTHNLLGPLYPYRAADITSIPTLPSAASSGFLRGLLFTCRQLRSEALSAIYAAAGVAVFVSPHHGDTVRRDRPLPAGHPARLQRLAYTLPTAALGRDLVRLQLRATTGFAGRSYTRGRPGYGYDFVSGAAGEGQIVDWPSKLAYVVRVACPRLRHLAVAVEGDGGVRWIPLVSPYHGLGEEEEEEDGDDDEIFTSAAGFWIESELDPDQLESVVEGDEDGEDGDEDGEDGDEDEEYGDDGPFTTDVDPTYELNLMVTTRRPRAKGMLDRRKEVADLLAWTPPVESELRSYSVVVRQNLGFAVLDVAGKVERRVVLGRPFRRAVEESLDLKFWEVVWDWLTLVVRTRARRERMIEAVVEESRRRTSAHRWRAPGRNHIPASVAANLTAHAKSMYCAWVDAGKPSAKEIKLQDLDREGGPLEGLFALDNF